MTCLQSVTPWLEPLAHIAVIVGIPIALLQHRFAIRKEQLDREYGTYDELDDKFIEFQRMCIEHPKLDVWDVPDRTPQTLTAEEQKRELQLFTVLFAIFERAYVMYRDVSSKNAVKREEEWNGWNEFILAYSRRANFRQAWKVSGQTFHAEFQQFMSQILDRTK